MQTHPLARIAAVPLLILAWSHAACAADPAAPTTCKDGTASTATGRGACSGHGGVDKSAPAASSSAAASSAPAASSPASSAPATGSASAPPASGSAPAKTADGAKTTAKPAASGNTDPTGATAKCTDGTYSKAKTHSGACSHHGGVAQWLGTSP
jgi:hypothetical protein